MHTGCFQVEVIANGAAMSIGVQVSYGRMLLFLLDEYCLGVVCPDMEKYPRYVTKFKN